MRRQTDFVRLYRSLGIEPDCSLEEFKQAYRRRVRDLHPDRQIPAGRIEPSRIDLLCDALKELNLRYASALEFHRHHGRLPGAIQADARNRPEPTATPQSPIRKRRNSPAPAPDYPQDQYPQEAPRARQPRLLAILALCTVAAVAVWIHSTTMDGSPASRSTAPPDRPRMDRAAGLALGMDTSTVQQLLGAPVSEDGDHWIYGPSWVRFECARVVAWHSSALHPLPVARTDRSPAVARIGRDAASSSRPSAARFATRATGCTRSATALSAAPH